MTLCILTVSAHEPCPQKCTMSMMMQSKHEAYNEAEAWIAGSMLPFLGDLVFDNIMKKAV